MTCIVGVQHEGKVWIGGDSAGVAGWSLSVRADEKVFRNGPMIMGFTSSFRMGQLLRYSLTVPHHPDGMDADEWMCTAFVDEVRRCLSAGGFAKKDSEVEEGGFVLVGYRGVLYQVESDYQVARRASGYDAIGSGSDIALGALAVTQGMAPKPRVLAALKAAERHNAAVCAPFRVVKR